MSSLVITKTTEVVERIDHAATGAIMCAKRVQAGLSLRTAASQAGISAPYLLDLERGHRNWSAALVAKVEAALNA